MGNTIRASVPATLVAVSLLDVVERAWLCFPNRPRQFLCLNTCLYYTCRNRTHLRSKVVKPHTEVQERHSLLYGMLKSPASTMFCLLSATSDLQLVYSQYHSSSATRWNLLRIHDQCLRRLQPCRSTDQDSRTRSTVILSRPSFTHRNSLSQPGSLCQ